MGPVAEKSGPATVPGGVGEGRHHLRETPCENVGEVLVETV